MSIIFKRISALVAMMMVLSLVAACDTGGVDGTQVVRNMQAAVAKINTTHSSVQVHIDLISPPVKGDLTAEFWQQMPALFHGEIKSVNFTGLDALVGMHNVGGDNTPAPGATPSGASGSPAPDNQPILSAQNMQGSVLVADGSAVWLYTPASNRVYKASLDTKNVTLAQTQVFLQGLQGVVDRILAVSDVKGVGEEQIGGRDTYKLELTAKQNLGSSQNPTIAALLTGGKVTLWVDKQLNVPLKLQYDNSSMGTVSVTAVNPEFNQPIDPAKFQFAPPANAKVVNLDTAKPTYMTLGEARTRAGYNLLIPTYLPDSAVLVGVAQADEPNPDNPAATERITFLNFQGNTASFDIIEAKNDPFLAKYAQQQAKPYQANATVQTVTVRGVTASAITYTADNQPRSLVYWTDKSGIIVSISGNLNLSDTLKVAESLK
ncbi:MAG: hypothetical protein DLM69_03800 [Candidatus Chloroheliales bacterium]|nr:MAG: hypothetical protein DLM69_03800 [Chloroflexota bacterium]